MRRVFTWMAVAIIIGLQSCGPAPDAPDVVKPQQPNIYYIYENRLVLQQPGRQPEEILVLPELGQVKDALKVKDSIFVLREQGLQKVSLADKTVDLVEQFRDVTVNGALLATIQQDLLIYAVDNKVELYDLGTQTLSGALSQPGFFVPLGLSVDDTKLYLVPRGGDPEFPEVLVLNLENGKVEPLPIGIGTEAALSPNSQYLAVASTHDRGLDKPLEYGLTVFDLASPQNAERILSLPNSPSHSHGRLIWSPDSQDLYFLLRPHAPYDDPATSYGLWRFQIVPGTFSQVANINNPDLIFVCLSPDGESAILLPETGPYMMLVDTISGEVSTIDVPTGPIKLVRLK